MVGNNDIFKQISQLTLKLQHNNYTRLCTPTRRTVLLILKTTFCWAIILTYSWGNDAHSKERWQKRHTVATPARLLLCCYAIVVGIRCYCGHQRQHICVLQNTLHCFLVLIVTHPCGNSHTFHTFHSSKRKGTKNAIQCMVRRYDHGCIQLSCLCVCVVSLEKMFKSAVWIPVV